MEFGAGIFMPIFSLPSSYSYGSYNDGYKFVDYLVSINHKYWQLLPLNDVDKYGSPFTSTSMYSYNPLFIDLTSHYTNKELKSFGFNDELSYAGFKKLKMKVLKTWYYESKQKGVYDRFFKENKWVKDYSVFMSMLDDYDDVSNFSEELLKKDEKFINKYIKEKKDKILFYAFTQYIGMNQWKKLKKYANGKGIKIIGDSPLYCAKNSSEAYFYSEYFNLDERLNPKTVGGVPPDYFSDVGQVWNNLIYNFDYIKTNNYKYFLEKYRYLLDMYDYLKLDHFRAFEYYYSIPYGSKDGINGSWNKGLGYPFIDSLKSNNITNLILEDLGDITQGVRDLRDYSGYPYMKVYQFGFDGSDSCFLPHNYNSNSIAYTGTHDNDTFYSFILDRNNKDKVCDYLKVSKDIDNKKLMNEVIKSLYESKSNVVIINPQDILCDKKRFNSPGTIKNNWNYNTSSKLYKTNIEFLKNLVKDTNRYGY